MSQTRSLHDITDTVGFDRLRLVFHLHRGLGRDRHRYGSPPESSWSSSCLDTSSVKSASGTVMSPLLSEGFFQKESSVRLGPRSVVPTGNRVHRSSLSPRPSNSTSSLVTTSLENSLPSLRKTDLEYPSGD